MAASHNTNTEPAAVRANVFRAEYRILLHYWPNKSETEVAARARARDMDRLGPKVAGVDIWVEGSTQAVTVARAGPGLRGDGNTDLQ